MHAQQLRDLIDMRSLHARLAIATPTPFHCASAHTNTGKATTQGGETSTSISGSFFSRLSTRWTYCKRRIKSRRGEFVDDESERRKAQLRGQKQNAIDVFSI